jgi:hypothetical protein
MWRKINRQIEDLQNFVRFWKEGRGPKKMLIININNEAIFIIITNFKVDITFLLHNIIPWTFTALSEHILKPQYIQCDILKAHTTSSSHETPQRLCQSRCKNACNFWLKNNFQLADSVHIYFTEIVLQVTLQKL